jgi:hypothetical protein
LAARRRWNWSSVKSRRSELGSPWLPGYAPGGGFAGPGEIEDWDEERLGYYGPALEEAA